VLRPRAVLTLAMAFHELTTNAAKYGALSAPGGRVEIAWQRIPGGDGGRAQLKIDWVEQGGPTVAMPKRRGFGTKLIEGSISAELAGEARLIYDPSGLRCEMTVPLEAATEDAVADHY
jgi:two-component sensor histidine kinase